MHSQVKATVVYICEECYEALPQEWSYLPLSEGKYCPMEGHERSGKMRKRRVWICPDCPEESHAFLGRRDFLEHVHD